MRLPSPTNEQDPWEILGLQPGATVQEIRERYLHLVKQHSPEKDPERFTEIQQAYEQINRPELRLANLLFPGERDDPLGQLGSKIHHKIRSRRWSLADLQALARDLK